MDKPLKEGGIIKIDIHKVLNHIIKKGQLKLGVCMDLESWVDKMEEIAIRRTKIVPKTSLFLFISTNKVLIVLLLKLKRKEKTFPIKNLSESKTF